MKLAVILFFILFPAFAHEGHGGFFHPCHDDELSVMPQAALELADSALKSSTKLSVAEFYKKFKNSNGIIIKGSANIEASALERASGIVEKMLVKRPDLRSSLIANHADVAIIATNETFCDIPETSDLASTNTFDGRNFCSICGGGGVIGRPVTTVCEDNLLKTKKDPYHGSEDILTHEFAHTIHLVGMNSMEQKKIADLYEEAKTKGMFTKNQKGEAPYAMANDQEFFASFSAAWFGVHNPNSDATPAELKGRDSIKEKFPALYDFLKSVYGE